MAETHKQRATGRTQVHSYLPTTFDDEPNGPTLSVNQVTETFSGGIEGEGEVRVIEAKRKNGSASFVGIERVRGSIAGRAGTFLLQVSGSVTGESMKADWFVIPQSATGALRGLRGDGGFEARVGQHGSIWLDYYFES